MAQVRHGGAATTARVRAQIQSSQAPTAALARRYGVNPKTVTKWRRRDTIEDRPMGPKQRRSTVLTELEEAAVVAVRMHARLPLDGLFVVLRDVIPHLTRSSLHRCLVRHGVSRLPKAERGEVKRFKAYELGYFHIDICELRLAEGKAFLFIAVDRTSKFVFARLYRKATKVVARGFLKALTRAVPYKIHTVLTDNGAQFSDQARTGERSPVHPFTRLCRAQGIEHRLTKPYHPWTNGQAERMVRTIKDATVDNYHYASIPELRRHIRDWLAADNFAKQLKALRWQTPAEAIHAVWRERPHLFRASPDHHIPGLNT